MKRSWLLFALLLAGNAILIQFGNVHATTGLLKHGISLSLLPLWIVDMILVLGSSTLYGRLADRVPRRRLLLGAVIIEMVFYAAFLGMHYLLPDDLILNVMLYSLSDIQYAIFPLLVWSIVADNYSSVDAKKTSSLISSGIAVGNLLGSSLAAFLPFPVALLVSLLITVTLALMGTKAPVIKQSVQSVKSTSLTAMQVGRDFVKNVPLFRFLFIFLILASIVLTILEYRFLIVGTDLAKADPASFQAFYALYRTSLFLVIAFAQWAISKSRLKQIPRQSSFYFLPLMCLGSIGLMLLPASLWLNGVARGLARLTVEAWNTPARKDVLAQVASERRGRLSVFIESYSYALGTLFGCLVLFLFNSLWPIPLVLAALGAGVMFYMSYRIERVYHDSLLDHRFRSSKRRDNSMREIYSKLDFGSDKESQ